MKKINYTSESEMCKDITELISGILIPIKHRFFAEVPRSSHNNHSDMLFMCDNGTMFIIEYKLSGIDKLKTQINQNNNPAYTIGIINQDIKKYKDKNTVDYGRIFQYTGEEWEIDKLSNFLLGMWRTSYRQFGKDRFYDNHLMVYWWGYRYSDCNIDGGIKSGKRMSFYELYKQAIKNILITYDWKLDFEIVYSILGFYSYYVAKKYFDIVISEKI